MSTNRSKILQWSRRLVATIIFAAITFSVVAPANILATRLSWINQMQLIPATLVLSIPTLVIIALLTMIFGRLYCSTVCSMGWLIDLFARLPRLTKQQQQRRRYRYTVPRNRLRLFAFLIIVGSVFTGWLVIFKLFSPFSAYCSMTEGIMATFFGLGLKLSALTILTAWLTLIVVAIVSIRRGRALCNTVCPVGTLLGVFSRKPLLHIDINTDRCTNCRRCVDRCKSSCIDLDDHVVDMTRCVVCFDCLTDCEANAISYTTGRHRLGLPMLMSTDPTVTAMTDSAGSGNHVVTIHSPETNSISK